MPKPEASIKLQKDLEYTAAHCRRGGAAPSCRESSLSSNCKTACGRIIPVWTDEYRSGLQKYQLRSRSQLKRWVMLYNGQKGFRSPGGRRGVRLTLVSYEERMRKTISWLKLTPDLHTSRSMGGYKDIKRPAWRDWPADIILPGSPQRTGACGQTTWNYKWSWRYSRNIIESAGAGISCQTSAECVMRRSI